MKRGRKPANGIEAKTELFTIRMSRKEYERLAYAARSNGFTMTDVVYIALDEYYMMNDIPEEVEED